MTLHYEQIYPVNTLVLWEALTKVEQMQKWYFPQLSSFEAKSGFTTSFKVFNGHRTFTHLWKVIAVVPYSYLKYQWYYLEYTGDSTVEFTLNEKGNASELQFKHTIKTPFPPNIPEFTEESGAAGWDYLLKRSLKKFLDEKSKDS